MQFYIVDVFAETPLSGNQLAVIRGTPDDATMQAIAQEMNFSETTFITSDEPRAGGYDVRIFTPNQELPFAGHPTLGTAFVIMNELMGAPAGNVVLNEQVGQIPVHRQEDGVLWMRQNPPQFGRTYDANEVAAVLNLQLDDLDTRYPVQEVSTGVPFVICPLKTLAAVKRAAIDLTHFQQMLASGNDGLGAHAIYIFAPEAELPENDFHARCFVGLLAGPPEDPATGSATGCFTAYLVHHGICGTPHVRKRVEQGFEIDRPSLLFIDTGSEPGSHVLVGGRVQMIARGEWL